MMKNLISELKDFKPGDLIKTIAIQELIEAMLDNGIEEFNKSTLEKINKYLVKICKSGPTSTTVKTINKYIETLEASPIGKKEVVEEEPPADNRNDSILIEDKEVLHSFIQEAQDHLESIEGKILKIESGFDSEHINDIFRSMHTIKGVSSFIGLKKIKDLSHSLESLLDDLRDEKIQPDADLINILLEGTDTLHKLIISIENQAAEQENTTGQMVISEPAFDIPRIISEIEKLRTIEQKNEVKKSAEPESLVSEEMVEKFISESSDLLDGAEQAILESEKNPDDSQLIADAFRSIHTIKGNAGFFWFKEIETSCMEIESYLDNIRNGQEKISNQFITEILKIFDVTRKAISELEQNKSSDDGEKDAEKPLGEVLVDMGIVTEDAISKALDMQQMRLGEILIEEGNARSEDIETALKKQGKDKIEASSQVGQYSVKRKDIRVETGKLDKLFDLMGELITAEAMVLNNSEIKDLQLKGFEQAAAYLQKITREMQEITMTIRMVPLEGLFNKMRRLVRDLSRKFDKKVQIVISGEETEMDKNVIDEISDPLVHIIRNSIDHGIETTEARTNSGKNDTGTVRLSAKHEGNEIWITIEDDGRGLDRSKILEKAIERGLVQGDPEKLSDNEVWRLVFEPGFSTAEAVSEISGRGVGMDVVRKNIEKLRGKIDIKSSIGEGTEIILRIPLTLAILEGVTARIGDMLYSLPISDILTFHQAAENSITSPQPGVEVVKLREDLIPVIKLHEVLQIEAENKDTHQGILIVIHSNGRKGALLADEIVGYHQLVIKALPEYMRNVRSLSGCSILGDGGISLIIDTRSLLENEFV
jgi:two-component system, chemotaxis family, sensor kinase CheA